MERLTKRNSEGVVMLAKGCHDGCEYLTCHIEEGYQCNHQCEADCMCKLAKYEDAEENGMLIHLPCRVGDTLYQPINEHINEYKVIGLCFDILQNKWIFEVAYEVVGVWNKTTCDFDVIGKTVFLTREEAEQALKKMGE